MKNNLNSNNNQKQTNLTNIYYYNINKLYCYGPQKMKENVKTCTQITDNIK